MVDDIAEGNDEVGDQNRRENHVVRRI
jgi:hypothetical protein